MLFSKIHLPRLCQIGLFLLLVISFCLFFNATVAAQEPDDRLGFRILNNKKVVKIPFKEVGNLIVVPVMVENTLPLQFVLDTGVRTAILTDRVYGDLLNINYIRKYTLRGAGGYQLIEAYVASDVSFSLPDIQGNNLSVLVLEEDYLDLSSQLGYKVDGILGYEFFRQFVVKIDYENHLLTIYDPAYFKPSRRYEKMALRIEDTKPYIEFMLEEVKGAKKKPVSLMLDTGASHALLLHQDESNNRFNLPEKTLYGNLGRGLGGELLGHIGRVESLELNGFHFKQVLASYPQDSVYGTYSNWTDRGGTVGGNLLNRFVVIFDYPGDAVYFKKGGRYKKPFIYNMSGLSFMAKGPKLNSFEVQEVKKGSPAHEAGVKVGDELLKINGHRAQNMTLPQVLDILGKKEGKKIKLLMERDGKEYKTSFRLNDII